MCARRFWIPDAQAMASNSEVVASLVDNHERLRTIEKPEHEANFMSPLTSSRVWVFVWGRAMSCNFSKNTDGQHFKSLSTNDVQILGTKAFLLSK